MFYISSKLALQRYYCIIHSIICLSPAQSDMRKIYMPYVILLVSILGIGSFPPGVLDIQKRQIHTGGGEAWGEGVFFVPYSFSSKRFFWEKQTNQQTKETKQKPNSSDKILK